MSQNTSHAVMAQRVEAHDSLDFFPTPPWATRALCYRLEAFYGCLSEQSCWEPACGAGDMVRPLREYFANVRGSDVAKLGYGDQRDFLFPDETVASANWIITNPPFRLAEQFVRRAIEGEYPLARSGCAMFVRTSFLEGVGRFEKLFTLFRPHAVWQFTERVPIHKGRLTETGSTATAYCWVIWRFPYHGKHITEFDWIGPCRKLLERKSDYAELKPAA